VRKDLVAARQRAHGPVTDVWCATSKVVFGRTLDSVQGNARLAQGATGRGGRHGLDATDKDVAIGGAGLPAAAIGRALVERAPRVPRPVVVVAAPFVPPVTKNVPLD